MNFMLILHDINAFVRAFFKSTDVLKKVDELSLIFTECSIVLKYIVLIVFVEEFYASMNNLRILNEKCK